MGHVQDLWFKTADDPGTGRSARVKTRLHGTGKRYRVRYFDPDGRERSKSFPDRHKKQADHFLAGIEHDKRNGNYCDPTAGQAHFEPYARAWLASQTFDEATRESVGIRLRKRVYPALGSRPLVTITPAHIRTWDRGLQEQGLAASYRSVIFAHVQAILSAAVDDAKIRTNPCKAASVRRPRPTRHKVTPWTAHQVRAVHDALTPRYQITLTLGAGLGLRQGETLGLAIDDLDPAGDVVHITRQVKIIQGQRCFGPPKGGKTRDVPLPQSVAAAITDHINRYPPIPTTLPWQKPAGPPATAQLIIYTADLKAVQRQWFNGAVWQPALRQAGITPAPRGNGYHALRHFYASTLLDAGESVVALADYLGHHDPGFTLRTYTHLMATSQQRTQTAIDNALNPPPHGTSTA